MTTQQTIQEIQIKSLELPRLSNAAITLLSIVDDPEVTKEEVEYLVSVDATLAAQAYKYANSAAWGLAREIESISDIVNYLGLIVLKKIAAIIASRSIFTNTKLWEESVALATIAKEIAEDLQKDERLIQRIYLAALFENYGLIFLETFYKNELAGIQNQTDNLNQLLNIERERFGFNHFEISAIILPQMGLPPSITDIIKTQSAYNTDEFTEANAIIELARSLYKLKDRNLSEKLMEIVLFQGDKESMVKRFKLDKYPLNVNKTLKLFEKIKTVTSVA